MPNQYHLWRHMYWLFLFLSARSSSDSGRDNVPLLRVDHWLHLVVLLQLGFPMHHSIYHRLQGLIFEWNPVPRFTVLQKCAARQLDGLHGSDLRLHVSPQNMQCNLKTKKLTLNGTMSSEVEVLFLTFILLQPLGVACGFLICMRKVALDGKR